MARNTLGQFPLLCVTFVVGLLVGSNLKFSTSILSTPRLLDASSGIPLARAPKQSPITIGYAVSLIKCGDKQTTSAGLMDAAIVLRHSIHHISVRNPSSGSKYDYKMYAIVHSQAEQCSHVLKQVGYEIIVTDPPVNVSEIRGDYLRANVDKEWCCGSSEFVKLYAYSKIPEQIVVHVDMDFVFLKPMDELYDAMLYDANSIEGRAARQEIALERPDRPLPDKIDAFFTLDWPQVMPGRKPGFQAGFMVIRPNKTVTEELVSIIKEGNYTEGYSRENGWSSSGHGGYVGAMAMQGLMSYYYEFVRPEHAVELNQCRYNWMGMDVRWRAQPNFFPKRYPHLVGTCRNFREECEDCMNTDLDLVKNVHYTVCRKPWNCVSEGYKGGKYPSGDKGAVDTLTGNLEQCLRVTKKWHEYRSDFEKKLFIMTNDTNIHSNGKGDHKPDVFLGHCGDEGGTNYLPIQATQETLEQVSKLYE